MTHKIRVLIADDHTLLRNGIRALLDEQPDMTMVAEAGDGREAVRLAPGVVDQVLRPGDLALHAPLFIPGANGVMGPMGSGINIQQMVKESWLEHILT